jgi:hypothetical protein
MRTTRIPLRGPGKFEEPTFQLVAPLCHVAGELEGLALGNGISIERWASKQLDQFVASRELKDSYSSACWVCVKADSALVICGTPDLGPFPDDFTGHYLDYYAQCFQIENDTLSKQLRLMRMVRDGNISAHGWWWFGSDGSHYLTSNYTQETSVDDLYSVDDAYARRKIAKFLAAPPTGDKQDYIKIAIDHYDEAYKTTKLHLQHVSLMMALEALFTPSSGGELTYRVSRSAAALLGGSRQDAESLMKTVQRAYGTRSTIVHGGKQNAAQPDEISAVRRIVRRSIRALAQVDLPKAEVARELTAAPLGGFTFPGLEVDFDFESDIPF